MGDCKYKHTIEPMWERLKEIATNVLPCRRGDCVEELAEMHKVYFELMEDPEWTGCGGFQEDLLFNLGCAYEHTGELEKSIEVHQHLLRGRPDDHEALYTAGTNLCKLQRFDEALPLLEKAVRLQPDKANYQQNLDYARRGGPIIVRERIVGQRRGPIC